MSGSLRICKIAGITISIHVSWIIILVLLTSSLATGWFPAVSPHWSTATYWLVSVLAALLLFVSVLIHELAHSLVARMRGLPVKNIILFIFGGVSNIEQEPKSPGVEFQMTFVGPLASFLLGGLSYLLWLLVGGGTDPLAATLRYLTLANILLGIFNLVPCFPLDGGRVLRSIIWMISGSLQTATRITMAIGQVIAYLMILGGIWLFFGGAILSGIWIGFIGWFLLHSAQSSDSQAKLETSLKGVTVDAVMNVNPVTIPANISLQKLVHELLLPRGHRSAFVTEGDQLVGLVTLSDIRHCPHAQWEQTPVSDVMTSLEKLHAISPYQSLSEVLSLMVAQDVNQLPVIQGTHLIGVLRRDDIMRFLEVRRSLGLDVASGV
jgi:Zn-dependent protease/predicted transcriptional regulator